MCSSELQRENIHMDHGIFGSPDLDQSGVLPAKIKSAFVTPLLTSFTKSEKKKQKAKKKFMEAFEMDEKIAEMFLESFSRFKTESIKNEFYTDLITCLRNDIHVEGTTAHFIYANKMGEKYKKRYLKFFRDPDIREFNMQHEQWLFGGGKRYMMTLNSR